VRIERIEINNLRSFGPEKAVIELPADRNLVAVVGANNAGKSNLIAAVRLALGAARRADLDPAYFHQLDITKEVRVDVRLRNPLKKENIFRKQMRSTVSSSARGAGTAGKTRGSLSSKTTASTARATPTGRQRRSSAAAATSIPTQIRSASCPRRQAGSSHCLGVSTT
jgi:DNA repair exonuclease SbcCD ATPase subunit